MISDNNKYDKMFFNLAVSLLNLHNYCVFKISIPKCDCLLYPSGRQKIMFCAIKYFIFNESCSNVEYFSFKIGHIFPLISNIKIVGSDKRAK